MEPVKEKLDKIRKPEHDVSWTQRILISAGIALAGILVGVLQKGLDSTAVNDLPYILQRIDLTNYFGRLAVWILIATVISVYAETPLRASLNTVLFLTGMVAGYYAYSRFILGFLPESYMMTWIIMALASAVPAYICWYAKGEGPVAIIITAGILGVLLAQAFILTQGFYMTNITEAVTWALGVLVLYRKPKELIPALLLSIPVAFVYQLFIPYWG